MADLDLIRDTVLAEAELRELDLGMDGSKWKHGYIPLNPVAVAIKEKRWHNTGHPSVGVRQRLVASRAIKAARDKRRAERLAKKSSTGAGRPSVERKPVNIPGKSAPLPEDRNVDAHELDSGAGELRTRDGKIVASGFKSKRAAAIAANRHNAKVNAKRKAAGNYVENGNQLRGEAPKLVEKKPSVKSSKPETMKGKYLITKHTSNVYDAQSKKSSPVEHYEIHKVSSADELGRPTKYEHVAPTRSRADYLRGEKVGEPISGINHVSLDRADTPAHFPSAEAARAHLAKHAGEAPKRIVRVPAGLEVRRDESSGKHKVFHIGSGKHIGREHGSKASAENAATHMGKLGIDYQQDAPKVVEALKAKQDQIRSDEGLGHSFDNWRQGSTPAVHEGDLAGHHLSPATPEKPKAPTTRAGKQEAARAEILKRLESGNVSKLEDHKRAESLKVGQQLSYKVFRGQGNASTDHVGSVVHADSGGVILTSTHPETGKPELHQVHAYRGRLEAHASLVDTKGQKEFMQQDMLRHARDIAARRESFKGHGQYGTGTSSASEHWKRVEAEMARRKREKAKAG